MPSKFLRTLQELIKSKKYYDEGKLTKVEADKIQRETGPLIKFLIEYMQRKRSRELERSRIRVKHGSKFGEVILLDHEAYITYDIGSEEKEISKAKVNADGSLSSIEKSSLEELEKALTSAEIPKKPSIKEQTFENLKRIFGNNVEIVMGY